MQDLEIDAGVPRRTSRKLRLLAPEPDFSAVAAALRLSDHEPLREAGVGDVARADATSVAIVSDAVPVPLDLCRRVARTQPVVLLSSSRDFAFRLSALRAGVSAIVMRPVDPIELRARLDRVDPIDSPGRFSIVLVDDDRIAADLTAAVLESAFSTGSELFGAADRALYLAKRNGRNRTCVHTGLRLQVA